MKLSALRLLLITVLLVTGLVLNAQNKKKVAKEDNTIKFETLTEVKATPVKSQARTGTCWDYATTSFIESELLRMGKGEFDLSEMYTVRNTYPRKALKFIRFHGLFNFGQGGQAHDVLDTWREFGMVPEEAYTGLKLGLPTHNHSEMVAVLQGYLTTVKARKSGMITSVWQEAYDALLDVYLGENPESFDYKGVNYTPLSFAKHLEINPDDYIEFTSYALYPMWEKCIIEVPDNWSLEEYYNVPLNDFMSIMYNSLEKGYSIVWDGDVSDKYFSSRAGVAIVPEVEHSDASKETINDFLNRPQNEKSINQEIRDQSFIDYTTTDDHLMHLTGVAKDQNGQRYFLTKNSHGTERAYDGYLYMSDSFVRLRTIAILVHKDAVPSEIKSKFGIK